MVNQVAIIVTIAAILISIPAIFFLLFQAQGVSADPIHPSKEAHLILVKPAGANMTAGSNMTGAAGNTTGAAHDSSIHTTNPAAYSTQSTHGSGPSMSNVK